MIEPNERVERMEEPHGRRWAHAANSFQGLGMRAHASGADDAEPAQRPVAHGQQGLARSGGSCSGIYQGRRAPPDRAQVLRDSNRWSLTGATGPRPPVAGEAQAHRADPRYPPTSQQQQQQQGTPPLQRRPPTSWQPTSFAHLARRVNAAGNAAGGGGGDDDGDATTTPTALMPLFRRRSEGDPGMNPKPSPSGRASVYRDYGSGSHCQPWWSSSGHAPRADGWGEPDRRNGERGSGGGGAPATPPPRPHRRMQSSEDGHAYRQCPSSAASAMARAAERMRGGGGGGGFAGDVGFPELRPAEAGGGGPPPQSSSGAPSWAAASAGGRKRYREIDPSLPPSAAAPPAQQQQQQLQQGGRHSRAKLPAPPPPSIAEGGGGADGTVDSTDVPVPSSLGVADPHRPSPRSDGSGGGGGGAAATAAATNMRRSSRPPSWDMGSSGGGGRSGAEARENHQGGGSGGGRASQGQGGDRWSGAAGDRGSGFGFGAYADLDHERELYRDERLQRGSPVLERSRRQHAQLQEGRSFQSAFSSAHTAAGAMVARPVFGHGSVAVRGSHSAGFRSLHPDLAADTVRSSCLLPRRAEAVATAGCRAAATAGRSFAFRDGGDRGGDVAAAAGSAAAGAAAAAASATAAAAAAAAAAALEEKRYWDQRRVSDPASTASSACVAEGCDQRSKYAYKGSKKPVYCVRHRVAGMIDTRHPQCQDKQCTKQPSFGLEGDRRPSYCATHRKEGMINVASRRCQRFQCMRSPNFGFPGDRRASYCKGHRDTGMVDIVSRRCLDISCTRRPVYNMDGRRPEFCSRHKLPGMIDVVSARCQEPGCFRHPSFGYISNMKARRCARHRLENMESLKGKGRRQKLQPAEIITTVVTPAAVSTPSPTAPQPSGTSSPSSHFHSASTDGTADVTGGATLGRDRGCSIATTPVANAGPTPRSTPFEIAVL